MAHPRFEMVRTVRDRVTEELTDADSRLDSVIDSAAA
jgi:hypothetical protein